MITVIYTTSDKKEELEDLAHKLVDERLAACRQIDGPITSINNWDGKREASEEFRMSIKTSTCAAKGAVEFVEANHSYDIPEIIVLEAESSADYQKWVEEETS